MSLTQHDAHDVFGKIGVDSAIDGVLAPGGDDITNPIRLNNGGIAVFFDPGDFVADIDTLGQNVHKLPIEVVNALTQGQKLGRRIGGRHLGKGTSQEAQRRTCFFALAKEPVLGCLGLTIRPKACAGGCGANSKTQSRGAVHP